MSSYISVLAGALNTEPYESVYAFGRGKWVNTSTDAAGNITIGTPYSRRTLWFTQTDLNVADEIKVGDHESLKFEATALNLLNQRAVTAYWGSMDSTNFSASINPGGTTLASGAAAYQATENGYDVQSLINAGIPGVPNSAVVQSSQYGQPYLYQNARAFAARRSWRTPTAFG
jgi:hypothetical protein